ncbi:MAG: pseudouridine-5'-phosphate glycosidase, partial [Acidimicrobiia bacterium]
MRPALRISAKVKAAVAAGRPVVALESTVFSRLGLPGPAGAEALRRSVEVVTDGGAVPALTAVLDGVARVGIGEKHFDGAGPSPRSCWSGWRRDGGPERPGQRGPGGGQRPLGGGPGRSPGRRPAPLGLLCRGGVEHFGKFYA